MVDFVNFFFEYILQGFFVILFLLFGIFLILMMYNRLCLVFYIVFKKPAIRKKISSLKLIERAKFWGFNKEYFNDPFIKKYKTRTLFFLKAALGIWLAFLLAILGIAGVGFLLNYLFN